MSTNTTRAEFVNAQAKEIQRLNEMISHLEKREKMIVGFLRNTVKAVPGDEQWKISEARDFLANRGTTP